MPNLLILGAGSFGKVLKETIECVFDFEKIDFLDDNEDNEIAIDTCKNFAKYKEQYQYAIPAFGDNTHRKFWFEALENAGFEIPTVIHPRAFVSPSAIIEKGSVILPKAVVHTNSRVKRGCLINIGALIDHDVVINEFCHICIGANIKSLCSVDSYSVIQAGELVVKR